MFTILLSHSNKEASVIYSGIQFRAKCVVVMKRIRISDPRDQFLYLFQINLEYVLMLFTHISKRVKETLRVDNQIWALMILLITKWGRLETNEFKFKKCFNIAKFIEHSIYQLRTVFAPIVWVVVENKLVNSSFEKWMSDLSKGEECIVQIIIILILISS